MNFLEKRSADSDVGSDDSSLPASPSDTMLPLQPRISNRYPFFKQLTRHREKPLHPRHITRKLLHSAVVVLLVTALAIVTWLSLILTVRNRLIIPTPFNGLQQILKTYHAPNTTSPASPTWLENFSADILPVRCHSHNDYRHRVPLYEGLATGCTSTEADIWLRDLPGGDVDLLMGHNEKSLTQARSLRSLYLNPLKDILTHQQSSTLVGSQKPLDITTAQAGVFSMSPNTTLVLVLDFKTNGTETWPTVLSQLSDFRSRGWLTTWTSIMGVIQGPLTIVASGDAPFDLIVANETYRDIFYDAPLTSLSKRGSPYNSNNSYYASASLSNAIGKTWAWKLSSAQEAKITDQVKTAAGVGLKSRYWDTPAWPISWRNRVWEKLMGLGADVLNVDDLIAAARWDWGMCVVGGINICNS